LVILIGLEGASDDGGRKAFFVVNFSLPQGS
jgi:hypothetical protein